MKKKFIVLLLCLLGIASFSSMSSAAETPKNQKSSFVLDNTSLNIWISNSFKEYWGTFKWEVDIDTNTATLRPYGSKGFINSSELTQLHQFVTDFTFKVTDVNNKVIAERTFRKREIFGVRKFAEWIGNIKFRVGEDGLQVTHLANERLYAIVGKIDNYDNLNLENAEREIYSKFAIVPTNLGIYARYANQDIMDTNKVYDIYSQADRGKYLDFDSSGLNVEVSNKTRDWRLIYDTTRFAYRLVPVDSVWGDYNIFWNSPANDNVTLIPSTEEHATSGEYWHFKKKSDFNEFDIIPMRGSIADGEGYVLNLDADKKNISAEYRNGKTNQTFYVVGHDEIQH